MNSVGSGCKYEGIRQIGFVAKTHDFFNVFFKKKIKNTDTATICNFEHNRGRILF